MNSKTFLCDLFKIPRNEMIFDDFGCSLQSTILFHGRMFVFENFICFYSTMFGINKKVGLIIWLEQNFRLLLLLRRLLILRRLRRVDYLENRLKYVNRILRTLYFDHLLIVNS